MVLGIAISASPELQQRLAILPLIAAGTGVVASLIGTLFVHLSRAKRPQNALNAGSIGASIIAIVLLIPVVRFIIGEGRFRLDLEKRGG